MRSALTVWRRTHTSSDESTIMPVPRLWAALHANSSLHRDEAGKGSNGKTHSQSCAGHWSKQRLATTAVSRHGWAETPRDLKQRLMLHMREQSFEELNSQLSTPNKPSPKGSRFRHFEGSYGRLFAWIVAMPRGCAERNRPVQKTAGRGGIKKRWRRESTRRELFVLTRRNGRHRC